MKKTYEFVAVNGRAAASVSVTVYNYGTTNLATLYSDSAGTVPLANPVVTDVNGYYEFYAADGRYSLAYSGTAITPRTLTDLIIDDTLNPVAADAARVGADDGSSGSLWTTVQGFINRIISSAGASVVGFIQTFTGAVGTTVRAKLLEIPSPIDVNADATGVSNANTVLQQMVNGTPEVYLRGSGTYLNSSYNGGVCPHSNFTLHGNYVAKLKTTALNYRNLDTDNTITRRENINFLGVVAEGNTGNSDDWSPILMAGLKGGLAFGNNITSSFYGFSVSYSYYNDKVERRSSEIRSIGNLAQGNGSGFEFFSTKNSTVVGNIAYKDGTQSTNHGYRVTGYGAAQAAPGVDLKNYGTALAGNSATNMGNGISQQVGVYAASYAAFSLTSCSYGISMPTNTSSADDVSKGNAFVGIAIDTVINGISLEKQEKQVFEGFAIRNFSTRGVDAMVASSGSTYGTGKYNRFSGLIADAVEAGVAGRFEGSNGRIDITVADLSATGGTGIVVSGNFNVITVTGGGSPSTASEFLKVSGNNNIVVIAGDGIAQAFSEVIISGNKNDVHANLDLTDGGGKVTVSGTGNIISGNCGLGTIAAGNDITGVTGTSSVGSINTTVDAFGDVAVAHVLITTPLFVVIQVTGTTIMDTTVHTITSSSFKVRFFNASGAVLAPSTAVTAVWKAQLHI